MSSVNNVSLIIGYIGCGLIIISFFPQLYKIIHTKSSKDVSIGMYILLFTAQTFWTIYGILQKDIVVIVTNITSSLLTILIILASMYFKNN